MARGWSGARGRGLMQALVVARPRKHPPGEIVRSARERGLLVTRAGEDAVRLLPPLNCGEDEVDQALEILRAVAAELAPGRARARKRENQAALAVGAGGRE